MKSEQSRKPHWTHNDTWFPPPETFNVRGAEDEEREEDDGGETSPPPLRRPSLNRRANRRQFPPWVHNIGGGDSWRDGATADSLLLRPTGYYLGRRVYHLRGDDIDEGRIPLSPRLEGAGLPQTISDRNAAQDAADCGRGRVLRSSSARSSTRVHGGSSGTDINPSSTGETGRGVVHSTPLAPIRPLPEVAGAVGGNGPMRPAPIRRGGLGVQRRSGTEAGDEDDDDDELLPVVRSRRGLRLPDQRSRLEVVPEPSMRDPPAAPAQQQTPAPNAALGLRVNQWLVGLMDERPTNATEIVARLQSRRPQHMSQALWDHFVFITNEQREVRVPWETAEEATEKLDNIYDLTMARIREEEFNDQGQNSENPNPIPSKYHKKAFPTQKKKEAFKTFPAQYYKLANKQRVEEYGNSRKNGDKGACAKKLAQMMHSGKYWADLYEELEKWKLAGWEYLRGKGKKRKREGDDGEGKGAEKGKKSTTTTTTKPASKKGEEKGEGEAEDMEE